MKIGTDEPCSWMRFLGGMAEPHSARFPVAVGGMAADRDSLYLCQPVNRPSGKSRERGLFLAPACRGI